MTALALAGTERSPCGPLEDLAAGTRRGPTVAPDLVLPPGFDRVGDVVRFEQDSGPAVSEATREPRVATSPHLDPVPAGEGQEPALFEMWGAEQGGENGLRPPARAVDLCEPQGATPSPGTLGLPGAVASLEDQLAALRPATAARIRRYLASRGTSRDFAAAEGIHEQNLAHQLDRLSRHGGPLAEAIAGRKDGVRGADLVPCTRCGLRGHVAGDPDRCLFYRGSLGLGGQAAQAAGAGTERNPTDRGRRGRRDPFRRGDRSAG